jgi:hypothetical protein
MALDPEYFQLESALRFVWNSSNAFHPLHKRLVQSALPDLNEAEHPQTEAQLDQLQVALLAAKFLRSFEKRGTRWLADDAQELPEAFARFIHEVAAYFHEADEVLPLEFVDSLSRFVSESASHIATLNYDSLLYDALGNSGVLAGYKGTLLDGFHKAGFDNSNMDRYAPKRKAWFLHLHGSPLFIGNRKLMREARKLFEPDEDAHIVLTDVKHKPLLIERSPILSAYWLRLHEALAESDTVILFGYAGEDIHLNQSISDRIEGRRLVVVEWSGVGCPELREAFWKTALKCQELQLHLLSNILQFRSWRA